MKNLLFSAISETIFGLFLIPFGIVFSEVMDCSWNGSGQSTMQDFSLSPEDAGQSIRPVKLTCTEGKVRWTHPTGALLVHHEIPAENPTVHNYVFCIRPLRLHRGVSVYKRDENTLIPLITDWKPEKSGEICFDTGPSLSLFLQESSRPPVSSRRSKEPSAAGYFFSAKPVTQKRRKRSLRPSDPIDDSDDCKPCEVKELLQAFCSSSFVFKGRFLSGSSSEANRDYDLKFIVDDLIRKPLDFVEVLSRIRYAKQIKMQGTISFPSVCPVNLNQLNPKESFLIVAEMDLGRAKLRCGVLWEDWETIRQSKDILRNSPCELS